MNFNIYLDDLTGQQLNDKAQESGLSRNSLIRQAVEEWLRHRSSVQWPETIMNFQGLATMPAFETSRDELKLPATDPLA